MDEHYNRAKSTVFGSWYDSEMRAWLVDHGYLKSDVQAKREEASPLPSLSSQELTLSSLSVS